MKKNIVFLIVFVSTLLSSSITDSLEKRLSISNLSNKQKISIYKELSLKYPYCRNPEAKKILAVGHELLKFTRENKTNELLAHAYKVLGYGNLLSGNSESAMAYLRQSLETADSKTTADIYNLLGVLYIWEEKFEQANQYLQNSLKINKEKGDFYGCIFSLKHLAQISSIFKNYEKTLECYQRVLSFAQKADDKYAVIEAMVNTAETYTILNNKDKALEFSRKGLKESLVSSEPELLLLSLNNLMHYELPKKEYQQILKHYNRCNKNLESIGAVDKLASSRLKTAEVYLRLKSFSKALNLAGKSLIYYNKEGLNKQNIETLILLAKIHRSANEYDKAISYLNKSLKLAVKYNFHNLRKMIYLDYSDNYKQISDNSKALQYYIEYVNLNDSLQQETHLAEILKIGNSYHNLIDGNKKQKTELGNKLKETNVKTDNIIKYFSALVGIIITLLIYLIFIYGKLKRQMSEIIAEYDQTATQNDKILANKEKQLELQKSQLLELKDTLSKMRKEIEKEKQLKQSEKNNFLQQINDLKSKLADSEEIFNGKLLSEMFAEIEKSIKFLKENVLEIAHSAKVLIKINKSNKLEYNDIVNYLDLTSGSSKTMIVHLTKIHYMAKNFNQLAHNFEAGDLKTFNLKVYIDRIVGSFNLKVKNTNITIDTTKVDNIEIYSIPEIFSKILAILIINSTAHGFSGKGGKIILAASMQDKNLLIQYRDNGKGMDREVLNKIYKPFFTTSQNGTGLGMYIVEKFVTRILKGTIKCESTPGNGVVFNIIIPTLTNT